MIIRLLEGDSMLGFYEYPINFAANQSSNNARIVSKRSVNLTASVGPGVVVLNGDGKSHSTFFAITKDVETIRFGTTSLTPATQNDDNNFYLEEIGGFQYTLHHYSETTGNFGLSIHGTNAKLYRVIVTSPILQLDSNQMFSRINPVLTDRAAVLHESLRGVNSIARRANAGIKREVAFTSGRHFTKDHLDSLKMIMSEHPNFTLIRNSRSQYDEVFPATFGKENIQYPYGGIDWNAGYRLTLRIMEQ